MISRRQLLVLAPLVLVACGGAQGPHPLVMLYEGAGSSPNDVKVWKAILDSKGISYAGLDASALNGMTRRDFMGYDLLLIPGGNFEAMGKALSPVATTAIREAVQSGTNYLGICAGALLAGNSPYNGINLTNGVHFGFQAKSKEGVRKAAVAVFLPAQLGSGFHYWQDGPELSGWGKPIAKYYDQTPAVVQGQVGRGWVVLAGTHPEAPVEWFAGIEHQALIEQNQAFAASLLVSALDGTKQTEF
jgi:glutamine amidotransferase-like uncharacterized protein